MIVDLCTRSQLFTINKSLINMLLHINRFYKKKKRKKIVARFFPTDITKFDETFQETRRHGGVKYNYMNSSGIW